MIKRQTYLTGTHVLRSALKHDFHLSSKNANESDCSLELLQFFRISARSHWLLEGNMTSNNKTVL